MPPTKWNPLPIEEGGTDGTTPRSARRALGLEISTGGAANVNFLQSGTGAVARSVQSKERDWVSVTDFGTVDGVTVNTAAINAAIASGARRIRFPGTGYVIDDEIVLSGLGYAVTLEGDGFNATEVVYNSVTNNAAKGMIRITGMSNCRISGMLLRPKPGGLGGKLGFGVYITSNGTAVTQANLIDNVQIQNASDAGIQIGHVTTDIDTNVDGNVVNECFVTTCAVGVRVNDTNTNMTEIRGGQITDNTIAGIEIGMGARGITIHRILMQNNATKNIWIRNNNSGPISIRDMVCELGPASTSFLVADVSSGGVVDYNLLTLENVNCTGNYTVAGLKIIDYQGTGSVHLRNCRFGGSASTSGGAGATLSFKPVNVAQAGGQRLISEDVHLYDGAAWDVTTDTSLLAYFRWLDFGTYSGGSAAIDAPTNTPTWRLNGGINLECRNLSALTLSAGLTLNNMGHFGRQTWRVTVDKAAWTAAALTQDIVIATMPIKARVVGCYTDTTIKYAGLAGTIQLQVSVNAYGDILAAHDVKTAIVTKGLVDADMGTGMTRAAKIQDAFLASWTGVKQPIVTLTSSVGNLGTGAVTNLTTGSTTIYLITETMP